VFEDKVNIGLSVEASKIADRIEQTELFEDRISIAKFALAYAIKNRIEVNLSEFKIGEGGGTKWNIGSVDNDHFLRDLFVSLFPNNNYPYRLIEAYINTGLLALGEKFKEEGFYYISKLM
jgi:hypothetical protein